MLAIGQPKITIRIKVFRAATGTWEDHGEIEAQAGQGFWRWWQRYILRQAPEQS